MRAGDGVPPACVMGILFLVTLYGGFGGSKQSSNKSGPE